MRLLIWFSLLFFIGSTFANDDILKVVLQELTSLKKTVAEQEKKIHSLQTTLDSVTEQFQKQQTGSVRLKAEQSAEKERNNLQNNENPEQETKHDAKIFRNQNKTDASNVVQDEKRLYRQFLHPRTKRSISPAFEVGFTAARHHGGILHEGGIIVFETVITNAGSAYNPTTGIFVAPSDGLYVFFYDLECAKENGDTYAELVRDGARVGIQTYCHGLGDFDNSGTLGVLHLHTGDSIWIRLYDSDNRILGGKTIFSGFLV